MAMRTTKIVGSRSSGKINIELGTIPPNERDALCKAVLHGMAKAFEDPAIRADYENWKKQRQLRKEAACNE